MKKIIIFIIIANLIVGLKFYRAYRNVKTKSEELRKENKELALENFRLEADLRNNPYKESTLDIETDYDFN